jgi:cysteinyl-tRNA synthetase
MTLTLYNTLTKTKAPFKSIIPNEVKMYVCGPTVYDFLHIGNFRGAIFFNVVRNWLELNNYKVTYVYNYTDVDDKIIQKAEKEGVSASVISERYIAEAKKDFAQLRLRPHTHNPKVTEFMPEIITFIERLVERKKAYVIEGEVFFSIESADQYGKLSGKKIDELVAGQRVDVDKRKHNPMDFVLWKPAKPGEPFWDSPWSQGRPGWHIECSAMIRSILGNTIDIHGGGIDLIFPHHENEIAQGEGECGEKYCNHWMHNDFLNMRDEKMSKSLGNIISGREFIESYGPEVLKFLMLSTHYRAVLNISDEKIAQAMAGLDRVYRTKWMLQKHLEGRTPANTSIDPKIREEILKSDEKIAQALNDDFNISLAISSLFDVIRAVNALPYWKKAPSDSSLATATFILQWLEKLGSLLALFQDEPETILNQLDDIILEKKNLKRSDIESKIKERVEAKSNKNFAQSDLIRNELTQLGVEILDLPNGHTQWSMKKTETL